VHGTVDVRPVWSSGPAVRRWPRVFRAEHGRVLARPIGLLGAISGEHGVGLLERTGLSRELDPGALVLRRGVKQAFDPHGILNPGTKLA
jgi:glycolate oxidase